MITIEERKNDLLTWKNSFGGSKHIERQETEQILRFIDTDTKVGKDSVLFLVGSAGMGKSVVMRDVLEALSGRDDYHVVALKADMLRFVLDDDNDKIFDESIMWLDKVGAEKKKIFIIDQIDALSQCLSSNRKPLTIIERLLERAANTDNTKVLVSCRSYDLAYDPLLRKYSTTKSIYLEPLTHEQVKTVLSQCGRKVPADDSKLMSFLTTPLHLDLFIDYGKDDCDVISLQTLFDTLWTCKITNLHEFYEGVCNKVLMCVELMAETMYNSCRLTVDRQTLDQLYKEELLYLLSEGVLVESSNKENVMFLHQSLFDYAYARMQYERGKNVMSILEKEHQGLFVRNRVKQMISYIREEDSRRYVSELYSIFVGEASTSIRMHIKMLILTTIGAFEDPTPIEKDFVNTYVLTNKLLRNIFLEGIRSEEWQSYVFKNAIILKGIEDGDDNLCEELFTMCRYNIFCNPNLVIDFLVSLIKEDDMDWNRRLFEVVETCHTEECTKRGYLLYLAAVGDRIDLNHNYYLRQLMKYDAKAVSKEIVLSTIAFLKKENEAKKNAEQGTWYSMNYLSRNAWDLVEEMWNINPEEALDLSYKLIQTIDFSSRYEHTPDRFYSCSAYLMYVYADGYSTHTELVDSFIKYLLEVKDVAVVKNFFETNKYTESEILFYVLLYVLNMRHDSFVGECYEILTNKSALEGFGSSIEYQLEEMLKNCWPLFSTNEKNEVIRTIMTVAPKAEDIDLGENSITGRRSYNGYRRFALLSMINNLESLNTEVHKELERLSVIYGNHLHSEPHSIHVKSGWNAMPEVEINQMSDQDLVDAYRKYDKDTHGVEDTPTLTGNCRQLEELAKQKPDRYYNVVKSLFEAGDIRLLYMLHGLSGLIKSSCPVDDLTPLMEEAIARQKPISVEDKEVLMHTIRLIADFDRKKALSDRMFEYLCDIVKDYADDEDKDSQYEDSKDIYNIGINRIRGAAAYNLVRCECVESRTDDIFSALETCVNASLPTKGAIILQMALLNKLDKDRALDLYLNLVKDYPVSLLCIPLNNVHPLLYFINFAFERLKNEFFPQAMKVEGAHEVLAILLWIAWVRQISGAEGIFYELLESSKVAQAKIINYFNDETVRNYSNFVFPVVIKCIDTDDESVAKQLDYFVRDAMSFEENEFVQFIDKYTSSSCIQYASHSFLECMKAKVGTSPGLVLSWICRYIMAAANHDTHYFHYSDALSILTSAYNGVRVYDGSNNLLEEAMDTFDSMLVSNKLRLALRNYLNELDK